MRLPRIIALCLFLLLLTLSLPACRNRNFSPATPPNPSGREKYPSDFQCWIVEDGISTACLTGDSAAELFKEVKKAYKHSETAERFTPKEKGIMLVFCTGGTAPESVIPAYQLPNAHHYGVYTLYPDDTGTYSDVLLTANVTFFQLKKGSYESLFSRLEGLKSD
jgi:hypothetical protein